MPPFAASSAATLQIPLAPSPIDDESDSPIDSLSDLKLNDETLDSVDPLPRPIPLQLSRPEMATRSASDFSPSTTIQGYFSNVQRPSSSHRNRSPYSRSHLRSRSGGTAHLNAPIMIRAHSMPNPHTHRNLDVAAGMSSSGSLSPSPNSPMRTPARVRSPFRQQQEDGAPPRSPGFANPGAIESIQEDSELDLTPRGSLAPTSQPSTMASFTRSGSLRKRPASPLHSFTNTQQQPPASTPTISFPASVIDNHTPIHTAVSSGSSSPSLGPQRPERYNESYPSLHHFASSSSFSSMPSTPTSARSRSPSISSLETIEDTPDLESEAIEEERIERLKLAAERQERIERGEDPDADEVGGLRTRRSSMDGVRSGFGRVGRERKRWSVCGGERRADLDLETIWED